MLNQHAADREGPNVSRLMVRMIVVPALVVCSAAPAFAGSEERKGTGGALELRMPVGPRGVALGGSVVSDASGIDALFWNPAGLATIEGTEATFTHTQLFADMKLNYAAIGTKLGIGTLAFNAKVLSIGDIEVTTEDAPEGTGEIIQPTFAVLGVSWAKQFTDRVTFGVTTNFVREQVRNASAGGISFDFGAQYLTGYHGLRFGMSMKNFGPSMTFGGDDFNVTVQPPDGDPTQQSRTVSFTSAAFEQPSYFTLAGAYDLMRNSQNALSVMTAFQNNNFIGDNIHTGAEWSYRDVFALRGSWFGSIRSPIDATTGETKTEFDSGDDLHDGLAFGAGAKVKAGGSTLGIDVAWRSVRNFFDDTVEVGLKLRF
jgi:hypothetical protein